MKNRRSYSLGRLHLWTLVAALLAAILTSHPSTLASASAAVLVVAVFIALDLCEQPANRCVGLLAISYFACALAFAVFASFAVVVLFPPPQPHEPYSLWELFSGKWQADLGKGIADAIGEFIELFVRYFITFAVFTLLSFVIAVKSWRKHSKAKWIALLNLPGVLFMAYIAACLAVEAFQAS